jgi:hypothetical protein
MHASFLNGLKRWSTLPLQREGHLASCGYAVERDTGSIRLYK